MARPPKNRTPDKIEHAESTVDSTALEEAHGALTIVSQNAAVVNAAYGEGDIFQFDRAVARLQDVTAYETVFAIEAGALLCLIKANAPGRFHEALGLAGIDVRWAQERMRLAIKLKSRPSLQKLGLSKAIAIMSEDDDTLDALEIGGTAASLTLDEIDRMSVRELKATLRKEKAKREDEKQTFEKKLSEKETRIDKLLGRSKLTGATDRAKELVAELSQRFVGAVAELTTFREITVNLDEHFSESGIAQPPEIQEQIESMHRKLADMLREISQYVDGI